jgi:hypothetical protein
MLVRAAGREQQHSQDIGDTKLLPLAQSINAGYVAIRFTK